MTIDKVQALLNLLGANLHRQGNYVVSASVDSLEEFARKYDVKMMYDGLSVTVSIGQKGIEIPSNGEVLALGRASLGENGG